MDLIFYASLKHGTEELILEHIGDVVPKDQVVWCRDVQDLSLNLQRPFNEVLAVVLIIADEKDLVDILGVRNVLHDLRTVVILPDEEKDFLTRVLALRPRFVACAGENPDAVGAVLNKIKWNMEKSVPARKGSHRGIPGGSGTTDRDEHLTNDGKRMGRRSRLD